ncbi:hypothetical protein SMAC4_13425 [Sordaria macrospora]|uniref:uncharacterized protein n=1 Tax=Sordaria macrospora TaxID=5147 RepID=UPI002B2BBDB9|nr:hypothetical protein SMAC4_13425 [Sordaria macrospora]
MTIRFRGRLREGVGRHHGAGGGRQRWKRRESPFGVGTKVLPAIHLPFGGLAGVKREAYAADVVTRGSLRERLEKGSEVHVSSLRGGVG